MIPELSKLLDRAAEVAVDPEHVAELRRRAGIDGRRSALIRSGAPLTVAERNLLIEDRDLEATPALLGTRRWLAEATSRDNPGPNVLVLSGPEGTGRTFAAAWAIGSESGHYRDVEQFLYAFRRGMSKRARLAERRELKTWRQARVLVLAGVGGEHDVETMREALSRVLAERVTRRSRLTVLLTELGPEALLEHAAHAYDARTNERLRTDAVIADVRADT